VFFILRGMKSLRLSLVFALSILVGLTIAYSVSRGLGSDDVVILVGTLVLTGGLLGMIGPERPWLWALGIDVWMPAGRIWPPAPAPSDHRPSQPLPLPSGLASNEAAQWIVGTLIIASFPLMGAYTGMLFRKVFDAIIKAGGK